MSDWLLYLIYAGGIAAVFMAGYWLGRIHKFWGRKDGDR